MIDVSLLENYVDEQRVPLLAKSILGANSIKDLTIQTGCKGDTAINILDTTVEFGDGSDCGWDEAGESKFSQRVIAITPLKVNMSFCDKKLLGKWASYEVQVSALPEDKKLPFEQYFIEGVADGIAEGIENMIWQGTGEDNEFVGFATIIAKDVPEDNIAEVKVGASIYDTLVNQYLRTPEAVAGKRDCMTYVGMDTFRAFIQELVKRNLYHYDGNDAPMEAYLPGTNHKVVGKAGLNGTDLVITARKSNLVYGVDLESDAEDMALWYSKDNREHRLACEFVGGTQIAFPNEVYVSKINQPS